MVKQSPIRITIPDELAGARLDRALATLLGVGRATARHHFEHARVLLDGRRAAAAARVEAGQQLELLCDSSAVDSLPTPPPLQIVRETPSFLLVNKPAGQSCVPARSPRNDSLAESLLARYPETRGIGYRPEESGLLHRLDKETSGLVLVARTEPAFATLRGALSRGEIDKRYIAVVRDLPTLKATTVRLPLRPHPKSSRRVIPCASDDPRATAAVTHVEPLSRDGTWAVVEARASRAYRHQIRVHLASLGAPLAGDRLYGGPLAPALGERHALHATYIGWDGSETVPGFRVAIGLPEEFLALLGRNAASFGP